MIIAELMGEGNKLEENSALLQIKNDLTFNSNGNFPFLTVIDQSEFMAFKKILFKMYELMKRSLPFANKKKKQQI